MISEKCLDAMLDDYIECTKGAKGEPGVGPHAGFSTHQGDRQAVWSDRWKFLMRGPARASLFDVDADRHCKNDLSKSHPITMTYMGALLGQFQGAANKRDWRAMATGVAGGGRKVKAEQVEMDDEMQKQLENLGYFQR